METPATAQRLFIGREQLLQRCRATVQAGLPLWLRGERGIGKTLLARRIHPDALYLPQLTPAKQMLADLLLACYRRGWYQPPEVNADDLQVRKLVSRLTIQTATEAATEALRGKGALLILDHFDAATLPVVQICRQLGQVATLVICSVGAKPAHWPLLFYCTRLEVGRLSRAESQTLALRLLANCPLAPQEQQRVARFLVEEAQGVPAVMHELVRRARRRGDFSLSGLREESLSAHRYVDMTPALVVLAAVLVGFRAMSRSLGDHDLTVLLAASGTLYMLVRFFFRSLAHKK